MVDSHVRYCFSQAWQRATGNEPRADNLREEALRIVVPSGYRRTPECLREDVVPGAWRYGRHRCHAAVLQVILIRCFLRTIVEKSWDNYIIANILYAFYIPGRYEAAKLSLHVCGTVRENLIKRRVKMWLKRPEQNRNCVALWWMKHFLVHRAQSARKLNYALTSRKLTYACEHSNSQQLWNFQIFRR